MTRRCGIAILLVVALCGVALVTGCGSGAGQKPSTGASETTSAPAPDYADASNWLSQPSSSDAFKPVDVFYLYPTAYMPTDPSAPVVCSADNPQMRSGAQAVHPCGSLAGLPHHDQYLQQNGELKLAENAGNTQVIVSYNTVAPTTTMPDTVILPGAMAINPITWTRTEATATATQNLGSISLDENGYAVLDAQGQPKKVLGVADARIDTATGQLICSTVDTATLGRA